VNLTFNLRFIILTFLAACCSSAINAGIFQKRNDNAEITLVDSKDVALIEVAPLPDVIKEASGLEFSNEHFWTHNDGGNPILYCINAHGKLIKTIQLNHPNNGWEDLTLDDAGNLYVGAFGNNKNDKRKLKIYKIPNPDSILNKVYTASIIEFTYSDQYSFPPEPSLRNFDMDAFISLKDSLYLFSKNRTTPFTGYTKIYSLPNTAGHYKAQVIDSIFLGRGPMLQYWVTGADLSPDKKTLALLSHNCIWLIKDFTGSKFSSGKIFKINFNHFSHKAGICFAGNEKIYIVDEIEFGMLGGKLYTLDLSTLKSFLQY
jgi:hypothetical protein